MVATAIALGYDGCYSRQCLATMGTTIVIGVESKALLGIFGAKIGCEVGAYFCLK